MKLFPKYLGLVLVVFLFTPVSSGVTNSQPSIASNQESVEVVTTLNFLGDFVEALVPEATVTKLITASQDPHFYEPDSSDLTAMSQADLILGLGSPEFDEWLTDYIESSGDSNLQGKTHYVAESYNLEEIDPLTGVENPHFWLDPANAKILVNSIASVLIFTGIVSETAISDNLDAYIDQLTLLEEEMATTASENNFDGMKVVVDHPSFFYFLRKLGFDRKGALEEKEGEESSPQHLQDLIELMDQEDIGLIVASAIQAGHDVQELARNTNAKIAYLTPLPGIEGVDNYIEMIRYNLDALVSPETPTEELDYAPLTLFFFSLASLIIVKRHNN